MEAPNQGQQAPQQAAAFEGEESIHFGDAEDNQIFLAAQQPVVPNPVPVQVVAGQLMPRERGFDGSRAG